MKYEGKLYGKIGRKYIPLKIDSKEVDRLERIVEALGGIIPESSGVAGWHLNGNVADWEEILPEYFE